METLQQATKLLKDTEGKLRELVSAAASSGDYASVVQMAAWARTISELVKGTASEAKSPTNHASPAQPNGKHGKQAATRGGQLITYRNPIPNSFAKTISLFALHGPNARRRNIGIRPRCSSLKHLQRQWPKRGLRGVCSRQTSSFQFPKQAMVKCRTTRHTSEFRCSNKRD